MLRLTNYKKAYGSHTVLQIDKLQLAPGVYWVKGENGAGKTSFLKSIGGLIPFEGSIEAFGVNLRKQRMLYAKTVSFAEAEPVYPSFLTGYELLKFYLATKGGSNVDAEEIAETMGMRSYLTNEVGTYSSGMLKKLSLLLAFTGSPQLILLDEPFITLDVAAVDRLRELITEAHQRGVSFLLSSHQELGLSLPCHQLCICQQAIQNEAHVAGA